MNKEYSQREFEHIFLLWRGPYVCIRATVGENIWHVCLRDPQVSLFAWETSGRLPLVWEICGALAIVWATTGSLLSIQNYRHYILFCVSCRYKNILMAFVFFRLWLVIRTYILRFFFLVICWSFLRTEISVTLSIGNKSYSRHHLLFFSILWNHFVDVILRLYWIC